MLPEYIISKFKSRMMHDSRSQQYLHSRRRYYNSIPLLSIVATSGNIEHDNHATPNSNPTHSVWWRSPHLKNRTRANQTFMTSWSRIGSWAIAGFAFMLVGFLGLVCNNSCYATTTATLELGTSSLNTTVTQGDIAYLSSTISATTTDTESYTLTITGPTNLTGASTIAGANGNTPANMANNTWGYSYDEGSKNNESKTYKSFTGSAQELESGTIANGTPKNITFAAKFGSDAVSGHYSAEVKLSLVATPRAAAKWLWSTDGSSVGINSGITTMQEMTPEVCAQVNTPTAIATPDATKAPTLKLIDIRDGNEYTIAKLPDGKCWMTHNLLLRGNTNKANPEYPYNNALTSNDTNLLDGSTYLLPATLTSIEGRFDTNDSNKALSYYSNESESGPTMYYTWAAAIAESAISNGSATADICPKGWRLPTGGTSGNTDFFILLSNMNIGTLNPTSTTSLSAEKVSIAKGKPYNLTFTGFLRSGGQQNFDGLGAWWSANEVRFLYLNSVLTFAGNANAARYDGQAARCIAK